jgi:integrase
MKHHGLTALQVRRLTKAGRYADGGGLYLAISDKGAKSWVFMWKRNGVRRAVGRGSANTVSLAEARELAADDRKIVREGGDPPKAKALRAGVPTFGKCADDYIASNEAAWGNAKHRYQVGLALTRYAASLRSLPVDQITTERVLATLQPIWKTKVETAKRLRQRIEAVLDFAKAHGHRSGENPARWRTHLDAILPSPERLVHVEHLAAMDYSDIPAFMARLRAVEGVAARCFEFVVLTVARVGEVRGAMWSEIDVSNALWTIPAERMKAGREHRVPLSDRAVAILHEMEAFQVSTYVFPGFWNNRPLGDVTVRQVLRNLGVSDATTHGFRSSFRDWAGDETSAAHDVIEAALAHTLKNKTEAAYRRKTAFEKRRVLMQAWADFCGPASDKVISIHRA